MLAVNERKASHHIITAVLVGGTSCVTVHTKFVTVPLHQSFPLVGLWS